MPNDQNRSLLFSSLPDDQMHNLPSSSWLSGQTHTLQEFLTNGQKLSMTDQNFVATCQSHISFEDYSRVGTDMPLNKSMHEIKHLCLTLRNISGIWGILWDLPQYVSLGQSLILELAVDKLVSVVYLLRHLELVPRLLFYSPFQNLLSLRIFHTFEIPISSSRHLWILVGIRFRHLLSHPNWNGIIFINLIRAW